MPETITCASGNTYQWTRPPRHIHWRHGRTGQTFFNKVREIADGNPDLSAEERGWALLSSMSEGEAAALQRYMDDVLRAGLGFDPGDVPESDYWELFGRAVYGTPTAKVETSEGEMSAEALDTFRAEPGLSADGEEVPHVRRKTIGGNEDSRPAAM